MRYEYKTIQDADDDILDSYGRDGWKVVSVLWRSEGHLYGEIDRALLMREIASSRTGREGEVPGRGEMQ